jgi:hypothetical protein
LAALGQGAPLIGVGMVENLTPAADGFVTVYADASHLSFGQYTLTLSEMGSSGARLTETFNMKLTQSTTN